MSKTPASARNTKRRAKVKDLPKAGKDLTRKDAKKVRGGLATDQGTASLTSDPVGPTWLPSAKK